MPRVKLHRPTSPDDRPLKPQDEFEAGLFPEIAPEPAQPEKPKYEAWPDYVPEEVPHERTSYLPNIKQQALELFREGCGYKRTASLLGVPAYTVRDWARFYREGKFRPQEDAPDLFEGIEPEEEAPKDDLFHLPDIVLPGKP
ncbi:helix-turn-helix domain-containing protein [uncultured Sutterella sp.]|uniref:helix-turn-helix domain-containing protein n=1 Tax=uncultured Sutterella sp. TaxID=286133 RepID=UPI0025EC7CAF|nr:helix-turn-helix domain-containing protein [uncultured Sutterella sp.]